jgi:AcrR family transcriptional regulator
LRIVKEPEERRKEILDTAEKLFYSKGYAKTKIVDIINDIGMSKGNFYYYFKSKEEVMDAIITRMIDEDVAEAKAIAADPSLSVHEKVLRILKTHRAKLTERDRRTFTQINGIENPEMLLKTVRQTIDKLTPILAEATMQGIEDGAFKIEYPEETLAILMSACTVQFLFRIVEPSKPSVMSVQNAKAFTTLLERAVCADKGSFDYLFEVLLTEP